jgi:hypothetical protein
MTTKVMLALSVIGGMLITLFATQAEWYISYVLRVPAYIVGRYLPIYISIEFGDRALGLSVVNILLYSLVLYGLMRLTSVRLAQRHRNTA